jgi:hypothetical protein
MTWLVACAAPVPAAAPAAPAEMRVLVKLAKASSSAEAIAAQVTIAAGTQARYLAATSPQWHALALVCAGAEACEAAFLRLSANNPAFEVVQRDERKRIATP